MSLLVATLAFAAAQPAVEAPVDEEIVVIGNKLRTWRGSWRMNKGVITCKTRSSTRDKAIDAIGCDALVACVAPIAPRFVAIENGGLSRTEMKRQANALLEAEKVGECVSARRKVGIAALVAARRSKRT